MNDAILLMIDAEKRCAREEGALTGELALRISWLASRNLGRHYQPKMASPKPPNSTMIRHDKKGKTSG